MPQRYLDIMIQSCQNRLEDFSRCHHQPSGCDEAIQTRLLSRGAPIVGCRLPNSLAFCIRRLCSRGSTSQRDEFFLQETPYQGHIESCTPGTCLLKMSGVEVIGLILGGLPLIISFAEHYKEGFEPLVRWKRFKYVFRDFITSVDIQRQMFHLVLKKLLIRVQLEPEEKQKLLTRADYEGWRRDDVVEALKLRLGDSYQACMDLLKAMGEDLMDLQAMMSLKDGSIDWANPGEKQWKYQAKRIQLSFSENGTRTIQALEKKIQDLKNLLDLLDSTNDTLDEMKTTPKDTTLGKLFENIRRQASSLHSAIKNGWKCHCEATHLAGLQLQKRQASDSSPCFTMNFPLPQPAPPGHILRRKVMIQLKEKTQGIKRPQPVPVQDNYIASLRTTFDAKLSSESSTITLPIRSGISSASSSLSAFSLGSIFTKNETKTANTSSTLTANVTEISMDSQSR